MEISKKRPKLSCCPSDHSVFVGGDLESVNKDKLKEILTSIVQNQIFHVLKKLDNKFGHIHFKSKEIATDFYSRVQEKTFTIHDEELGNVEVYFLPPISKDCKRKYNDENNQVYNDNFNEQENQLKADIMEKSQQINNLREYIIEKDRQINNLTKEIKNLRDEVTVRKQQINDLENCEKYLTQDQFQELVDIVFSPNTNPNFINLKIEIKKLKLKDLLPCYEKEKENFTKLLFKAKENVGRELDKFLNLLLTQNEKIEKNQDDVSFLQGQLSAYRIILQEKIPYDELEILLNKQKKILKLENQLYFLRGQE